jgi:hypothetical protein
VVQASSLSNTERRSDVALVKSRSTTPSWCRLPATAAPNPTGASWCSPVRVNARLLRRRSVPTSPARNCGSKLAASLERPSALQSQGPSSPSSGSEYQPGESGYPPPPRPFSTSSRRSAATAAANLAHTPAPSSQARARCPYLRSHLGESRDATESAPPLRPSRSHRSAGSRRIVPPTDRGRA